jgi:hypothetical protein
MIKAPSADPSSAALAAEYLHKTQKLKLEVKWTD